MPKNLFVISGPSGAGEDSIIDGLAKELPVERVIATTTRMMRATETEGHPYHFVTRPAFESGIARGDFAEHALAYNGEYYGVTQEELDRVLSNTEKIGLWKIEWHGVRTAKRLYPDIIAILVSAPLEILEMRLRRRDNPDERRLKERMAYTREWLKHTDLYDYIVQNEEGKLEQAIQETAALIRRHAAA